MIKSNDPKQRFYDFLPDNPYWGKNKSLSRIGKKNDIITTANYIQLPTQKRGYISLDLDYDMAAFAWENDIFPEPTLIIMNKENGHAQYFYELDNPVLLPLEKGTINISWKAIRYFNAVTAGYQNKLEADKGFTQFGIKNPFSPMWSVFWSNRSYDLKYLAEFVDLPSIKYNDDDEWFFEGRHMQVFHRCRKLVYKIVKDFNNYDLFKNEVQSICLRYTAENIWHGGRNKDFLKNEVLSIARSITKYTWTKRLDKNFKNWSKNIGIMGLEKRELSLDSPEEKKIFIKDHQSLGAKHTHEARRSSTLETIKQTIDYLKLNNKIINIDNIIRFSNLSKSTVYKYTNDIKNIIDNIK